ncbi:MAG: biotin synthase BioB, partial [Candidatus Omnitrophica bacterium]|nr:biotin synthase BioB [Candidatus Omnitrophota bacterium]
MEPAFYQKLSADALNGIPPQHAVAMEILTSPAIDTMRLLSSAYEVRKAFRSNKVTLHIINNGQNGHCPEDCHYCAQAKSSEAGIHEYPLKSDEEFLAEAKTAYEKGAHRYCLVFAGRGPSKGRVERLAGLIRKIKTEYPLEICVSAGLLDTQKAQVLK